MLNSLDKNLLQDETIIFSTKKHWIIFFLPVVLTIITFFFYTNENELVLKVAFLPLIATVVAWVNQILLYLTSEFAITTRRIIMHEGFFFKHTNEMRLATIANASVNQSLLGQLLNYGTVIIFPFGGNPDPFLQIANPNVFQRQLQAQLDKITK